MFFKIEKKKKERSPCAKDYFSSRQNTNSNIDSIAPSNLSLAFFLFPTPL